MNSLNRAVLTASAAALLLNGCGGSGGGSSAPAASNPAQIAASNDPPTAGIPAPSEVLVEIQPAQVAIVTTSAEGASVFVKQLVDARNSDLGEGFSLGDLALATSETDEPDPTI